MEAQYMSTGSSMSPILDPMPKYDRDQKYVYKTSYQYSTTDGNTGNLVLHKNQNVNQLDALLEDLKNERQQTREKDMYSTTSSFRSIEPSGTVTKTTRIIKSSQLPMEVENITDYNNFNTNDKTNIVRREVVRNDSSAYNLSNTSSSTNNFESSNLTHAENNVLVPIILENDTKNLTLSDNILPIPGTKVTTTVRTYTYEIPAENETINNRTLLYKNNVYNSSKNESFSEPNLPSTVVYTTESYNKANSPNAPLNSPVNRAALPSHTNRVYEINDSSEYRVQRNDNIVPQPVQPTTKTIVYNINKTEHNTNTIQGTPLMPDNSPSHIHLPPRSQQSPHLPPGTTNKYYYRESTNTVNTVHGPRNDNLPPNVTIEYPRDPYDPQNPTNTVTYKYSSSTMNSRNGPSYDSPSAQPPPFPVDGVIYPDKSGNPPEKLNDLLDAFGGDNVDGKLIDTQHRPKREIETALATSSQQTIPSINKAGPAVYYPPGHEWLSKKEESKSGGYSASGKYAKASGMYEYESGYKSKSSSKSGAAVVPVCLPLCCAMPCSIM